MGLTINGPTKSYATTLSSAGSVTLSGASSAAAAIGGSMLFTNSGVIKADTGQIVIEANGGNMTFNNVCKISEYQDVSITNDGSVGTALTIFNSSGVITSQSGKVQISSNGQGNMQFTNSADATCTTCSIVAHKSLEVSNSGGSLTFVNRGDMRSTTDQILVQNNGGSLSFENSGAINANKQIHISDNGTANSGIATFTNSRAISSMPPKEAGLCNYDQAHQESGSSTSSHRWARRLQPT